VARQTKVLEKGEKVVQETRGWNEDRQQTFSQRSKENAHDYRYFPEPDLPKLVLSEIPEFNRSNLIKNLPELPWQKRERYTNLYKLKSEDIETYINKIKNAILY
jgi:aspartyl-tRNA(Asn)/glutamyl-tRNA(Gln) amidotransferase subunit B